MLLYLRRKYKIRERQYWIHPILAVKYLEGSFYTLFEKVKSHDLSNKQGLLSMSSINVVTL